jgi:hypothetical protein
MATDYNALADALELAAANFGRNRMAPAGRGPGRLGSVPNIPSSIPAPPFPTGAMAGQQPASWFTPDAPRPPTGLPGAGFAPLQQQMARGVAPAAAAAAKTPWYTNTGNLSLMSKLGRGVGGFAITSGGEAAAKQLGRETLPGEITSLLAGIGGGAVGGSAFGLPGAIAGGVIGGGKSLLDTFTKDYSEKKTEVPWDSFTNELDPETINTAKVMHKILEKSSDKKTADAQVNEWLLAQIQTSLVNRVDEKQALAQQQMIQQFMQPYLNDMMQSSTVRYNMTMDNAASLPPGYREIAMNQAQQELAHSQRTGASYGLQAQLYPGQLAQQKTQSQFDQLAQQAWQAAAANPGGGTSSLDEQLAALAGG